MAKMRKKQIPQSPADHVMKLMAACQWGGTKDEIESLLSLYSYRVEELERAVSLLSASGTSAAEVNSAVENIRFLEMKIRGMKAIG